MLRPLFVIAIFVSGALMVVLNGWCRMVGNIPASANRPKCHSIFSCPLSNDDEFPRSSDVEP